MMPVPAMMMPMPMVPAMVVPVMMVMPTHLGGELPRILLNRAGRTGIDQRDRACTLSRRSHNEQRSNSRQAQNFRSVHINLLNFLDTRFASYRRSSPRRIQTLKRVT
jgi:hypothetical protein